MNSKQERRVDGIQRVPVEALVEVCGLRGDVTSFEAESRNVSDRGIRLRTAYLPDIGAPVVCRFESAGQEVLAEGVIAWRSEQPRGGEFGVRFTALNSRSAQVLGRLCRGELETAGPDAPKAEPAPEPTLRAGTKVKLHIDGLSSPMRARVQQGDTEQISVNSSLEFLRLGKRLQLENVDAGNHSEAYIDGIDVVIDPASGVPNLVVVLRSQENERTPEPSVIDTASHREIPNGPEVRDETAEAAAPETEEAAADAVAEEVARMRGKLEQSLTKVGLIVRITGSSIGRTLRDRGVPMVRRMAAQVSRSGVRRGKAEAAPARRRTSPPPSQISGAAAQGLRPQASSPNLASEAAPKTKPKLTRKALVTGIGATALLVTVIAVASRGNAPSAASNSSNPLARAAANDVVPAASVLSAPQPGASAVMAHVPLFGPTPMATLEPAPLGNAPPVLNAGQSNSGASIADRELAAAKAATAQVAKGSEEPASEEPSGEEPATKPEDVAPWGKGKMHDPVLYRIRLDGPGNAIKGTSLSKGFSVVIPKRKVEESPKGFAKQDERFEKVSAANDDDGTKIIWRFKEEPPGYRVRLRKNTIEFLISSKSK